VFWLTKAISFFAGAGGLDIGIHEAGFDIKLSVEIESIYCSTLKNNFPNMNVRKGDIMDYDKNRIYQEAGIDHMEEIDLIFGGSPCQSFSTAGKRQAFSDPRGEAMLKFAELVNEVQPKFFLLENVRGLLSAALKHRPIEKRGIDFPPFEEEETPGSALAYLLKKLGNYNVNVKLLNAADYGVPQKRERVFIIGVRNDLDTTYQFPEPTHSKSGGLTTKPWITVGEVLSRLTIKEHRYMNYSDERLKYMKLIPSGGGNWRDLPESIVQQAMGGAYTSGGGKVGFFRRLRVDEPSPTLLTSPAQKSTNLGHPYEDRPLSMEEYLAIQEFPVNYQVSGSLQQQYTQIGNAVPIRLARVLGNSIKNKLKVAQTV
jgi:DNA (cytosine-5)-methyltransferase 1